MIDDLRLLILRGAGIGRAAGESSIGRQQSAISKLAGRNGAGFRIRSKRPSRGGGDGAG